MSISVTKIVNLSQAALKFLVQDELEDAPVPECKNTIGGVLSESEYAWLAHGPVLEVVDTRTGSKIGAWTFGWILRDSTTEVVCVDEIQRPHGRLPILAVGVNCDLSDGMVCIFDFASSKIIRAIHISGKISNLHVIDSGYDIFTLPGPLRNFDGIIAVGTIGGDVHLVDICRQICDEAVTITGCSEIRNELNSCQLNSITSKDTSKIEIHKEFAIRNSQHLAIHLNAVFDKTTKHFTLKGPKGDDRIHVNKAEVTVSALYYCSQLGSLLVGYNFGALQLYNLMNLELVYTSPVCDEHIPISHFAVQEPADDPRAVCYIWAVYSSDAQYPTCLPLAVMYSFCYNTKEYHEGYGFLYQDFTSAAVQYQTELGVLEEGMKVKGGTCLKVESINQGCTSREGPPTDSNEDNLTLCLFVWNVYYRNMESDTFLAVFDLNQWYKEQMPCVANSQQYSSYMIQFHLNELIDSATGKKVPILDVLADKKTFQQFTGAQRLEAHFHPNSLSFRMTCLRESDIILMQNYGVQKALLARIESFGPLCLVEPAEIFQEVIDSGLTPLFIELPNNTPVSTNQQREIILGTALENRLMGWLCKCASEWANGSFISAGCSLEFLITWAFRRAIMLKTQCDDFCVPLFDYSGLRLDNNTHILLNSCTRQLKNVCSLYSFVLGKFPMFISNIDLVSEQFTSLQTVSAYFDVLQWLSNVGLLPECLISTYPRLDDLGRINAPYPAEILTDFYNHRRAVLKELNEKHFGSSESVLFIDILIEKECGGKILQEQWRSDGGNGLYPPPSLQALLRTYLMDDVELTYKHLVVMYIFLDLAMALEQDHYKSVITHLIKFPAVFKVSSSVIKITQAFWQLDHGDFNTAMGLLLDPLVSSQHLKQWHHRTVLKSLIMQNQHNFALLYVQVKTPSFDEDDDILTVISLYVANNMLDEAFYLEKRFPDTERRKKFLLHYFKECEKHDKLQKLIHRTFDPTDEKIFLDYLIKSKTPRAQDLHVHYHLLRSRFLEAFESHENSIPENMESRGLKGKERAHSREKLIHTFKNLLPDVTRNVISFCKKEKYNAWQQGSRPTPLSVFVLNSSENVKYKSSVIGAALSKARETFNETIGNRFLMETEGTPFLRTPTVTMPPKRSSAVIVNPKIVDILRDPENIASPPSCKRLKLSPRHNMNFSSYVPSKLETPLVKRKTPKSPDNVDRSGTTPQSILKVKKLINHNHTKTDGLFEDDFTDFNKIEYTPVGSSKKSRFGLSARPSITKSVVRFEGVSSSFSSSLNSTQSPQKFNESNIEKTSKNTSTEDDDYCTPNASLEENEEIVKTDEKTNVHSPSVSKNLFASSGVHSSKREEISEERISPPSLASKPRNLSLDSSPNETESSEEILEEKMNSRFSPRARRSYKKSLELPVRSSPRFNLNDAIDKSQKTEQIEEKAQIELSPQKTELEPILDQTGDSPSILPKLRPRKSLCRKVLESNAINRVLNSPLDSPRSRRSKYLEPDTNSSEGIPTEVTKVTTVEETSEKVVLDSSFNYSDGDETRKSILITKHNFTSVTESTLDTTEDFSVESNSGINSLLSESMIQYLKNCSKSFALTGNASQIDVDEEETPPDKENKQVDAENKEHINETVHVERDIEKKNEARNADAQQQSEETFVTLSVEESEDEEEVMEIVDERKHNETDYVVYQTLKNINRTCEEDIEHDETFDDESLVKPVETTDNDFLIETEISNENNDTTHNQSSLLAEKTTFVSSTPLSVFEKNVIRIHDSTYVEEESSGEEDDDVGHNVNEEEIIEIGSSSEEISKTESSSKSSDSDQVSDGNFDVGYDRNIYDTVVQDTAFEFSCSQHYSEESRESSEEEHSATKDECGLFQGEIYITDLENKLCYVENMEEEMSEEAELLKKNQTLEQDSEVVENAENTGIIVEESVVEVVETTAPEKTTSNKEQCGKEAEENLKVQSAENNKNSVLEKLVTGESTSNLKQHKISEVVESRTIEDSKEDEAKKEVKKNCIQYAHSSKDEVVAEEKQHDEENEGRKSSDSFDQMDELVYSVYEDTVASNVEVAVDDKSNNNEEITIHDNPEPSEITPEKEITKREKKDDVKPSEESKILNDPVNVSQCTIPIHSDAEPSEITHEEEIAKELKKGDAKPNKESEHSEITPEEEIAEGVKKSSVKPSEESEILNDPVNVSISQIGESHEIPIEKRLTRGAVDVLEKLKTETPKRERDIVDRLLTDKPIRKLRPRSVSTEHNTTPTLTMSLRKRCASESETCEDLVKPQLKKETVNEKRKRTSLRTRSPLAKIFEEGNDEKTTESAIDDYSANRRMTRRQLQLLKESISSTGEESTDLISMKPIVQLENMDMSSMSKKGTQPVRRGRSASQTSNSSQISDSGSTGRTSKRRTRKGSSDEALKAEPSESKVKEEEQATPRITRSRTRSVSSVNSEDSEVKVGRGKRTSNSTLPEIKEEPEKPVPKKRTRQNSSQI